MELEDQQILLRPVASFQHLSMLHRERHHRWGSHCLLVVGYSPRTFIGSNRWPLILGAHFCWNKQWSLQIPVEPCTGPPFFQPLQSIFTQGVRPLQCQLGSGRHRMSVLWGQCWLPDMSTGCSGTTSKRSIAWILQCASQKWPEKGANFRPSRFARARFWSGNAAPCRVIQRR